MNKEKSFFISTLIISIIFSSLTGAITGFLASNLSNTNTASLGWFNIHHNPKKLNKNSKNTTTIKTVKIVSQESAVVKAVEKVQPAVVSIIVSKDLPVIEKYYKQYNPFGDDFFKQFFGENISPFMFRTPQYRQKGTEKREIGGGTGFVITKDGYIVTNKHVVADKTADYTVLMNNGKKYTAKVLARDPVQDLAILKIKAKNLATVELGNSDTLKPGQTLIAIGNALGEFRNTVSTGVVSGLSRNITAFGPTIGSENLVNLIQTDASINPGNSGGPLLNIKGQVIGINVAIAKTGQNIGFAIPINSVKKIIESVKKYGRIIRPWLGVRYIQINKEIAKKNNLSVDYGAIVLRGNKPTDLAVIPGSPADKAGIVENDIILKVNGQKLDENHSLSREIAKYKPGDKIKLEILHRGKKKIINVKLEERKNL